MHHFTQKVQTAQGCFDISFREAGGAEESEYMVTVMEDDYAAPPFVIKLTNGYWKIADKTKVAFWIAQLETTLHETILASRVAV